MTTVLFVENVVVRRLGSKVEAFDIRSPATLFLLHDLPEDARGQHAGLSLLAVQLEPGNDHGPFTVFVGLDHVDVHLGAVEALLEDALEREEIMLYYFKYYN